eukprot:Skav235314  [mRNA]  locus=scaffold520:413509:427650:+ [translate_table: standard]
MKTWGNRFLTASRNFMRLVVDLPSPWTLVASALAFVLFSSQHPLAELLSHPNTLVRSHHHLHWGFPMYGSWIIFGFLAALSRLYPLEADVSTVLGGIAPLILGILLQKPGRAFSGVCENAKLVLEACNIHQNDILILEACDITIPSSFIANITYVRCLWGIWVDCASEIQVSGQVSVPADLKEIFEEMVESLALGSKALHSFTLFQRVGIWETCDLVEIFRCADISCAGIAGRAAQAEGAVSRCAGRRWQDASWEGFLDDLPAALKAAEKISPRFAATIRSRVQQCLQRCLALVATDAEAAGVLKAIESLDLEWSDWIKLIGDPNFRDLLKALQQRRCGEALATTDPVLILAKLSDDPKLEQLRTWLQKFALQLLGFRASDADRIASEQNWQIALDELSKLVIQKLLHELNDFLPQGMHWEDVEKSLAKVCAVNSLSDFVAKVKSPEEFARGCLIRIASLAVKEIATTYEVPPNIVESVFQTFERERLIEVMTNPTRFFESFQKEGGALAMNMIVQTLRFHLKDKMPDGITWEEVEASLKEISLESLHEGMADPATLWTRLVESFGPLAIKFALEQAKPVITELMGNMAWLDAKNVLVNHCSDVFTSTEELKNVLQSLANDEQLQKKFVLALARVSLEKHLPAEVAWSDIERLAEKVGLKDLRGAVADPTGQQRDILRKDKLNLGKRIREALRMAEAVRGELPAGEADPELLYVAEMRRGEGSNLLGMDMLDIASHLCAAASSWTLFEQHLLGMGNP